MILKIIGIDSFEICVLDQYDKEKFSFDCYFSNKRDTAKISLNYGDMEDFGPTLEFNYHYSNKVYDYYHEQKVENVRQFIKTIF
jgi:hypothetical protein